MFTDDIVESFKESLHVFFAEPFLWVPMLVFLLIATYTDVKERKIKNWLILTLIAVRIAVIPFTGFAWQDLVAAVLCLLFMLIPAMIVMQPMGGDIKASFVIGLYMGLYVSPVLLLIAAILLGLTIIVSMKLKGKMLFLPFAPFFLVGFAMFSMVALFT